MLHQANSFGRSFFELPCNAIKLREFYCEEIDSCQVVRAANLLRHTRNFIADLTGRNDHLAIIALFYRCFFNRRY
jgi:hypothetical protein